MAFEFWMVGGITTFLMWLTANLGLKRRFAYFKSQNASIDEVLADFEVRFFFIFREFHKYSLKIGIAASLYLIIGIIGGSSDLGFPIQLLYFFKVFIGL